MVQTFATTRDAFAAGPIGERSLPGWPLVCGVIAFGPDQSHSRLNPGLVLPYGGDHAGSSVRHDPP